MHICVRRIDLFRNQKILCSDVTIVTRHASASIGTKLVIDGEGQLASRVPCPREVEFCID